MSKEELWDRVLALDAVAWALWERNDSDWRIWKARRSLAYKYYLRSL